MTIRTVLRTPTGDLSIGIGVSSFELTCGGEKVVVAQSASRMWFERIADRAICVRAAVDMEPGYRASHRRPLHPDGKAGSADRDEDRGGEYVVADGEALASAIDGALDDAAEVELRALSEPGERYAEVGAAAARECASALADIERARRLIDRRGGRGRGGT